MLADRTGPVNEFAPFDIFRKCIDEGVVIYPSMLKITGIFTHHHRVDQVPVNLLQRTPAVLSLFAIQFVDHAFLGDLFEVLKGHCLKVRQRAEENIEENCDYSNKHPHEKACQQTNRTKKAIGTQQDKRDPLGNRADFFFESQARLLFDGLAR